MYIEYIDILLYLLKLLITEYEYNKNQEYTKSFYDNLISYPLKILKDFK